MEADINSLSAEKQMCKHLQNHFLRLAICLHRTPFLYNIFTYIIASLKAQTSLIGVVASCHQHTV